MEYYKELLEKARAYHKLAVAYKKDGHKRWVTFATLGKEYALKAIEVRNNI